jgi:hypothetical protein
MRRPKFLYLLKTGIRLVGRIPPEKTTSKLLFSTIVYWLTAHPALAGVAISLH